MIYFDFMYDIKVVSVFVNSINIRMSQTAAFPTFAANRKDVLNLSSQKDLVPN